jgi:hypothetical protein
MVAGHEEPEGVGGYALPVTLRKIVKVNLEHGIYLLEGGDLIFFPA